MPFLYLISIDDKSSDEKIAVLCLTKPKKLYIGGSTKIFDHKKIPVKPIEISIDIYIFKNIVRCIKGESLSEVHCMRKECFITIDNSIWSVGRINKSNIIIYKKLYFILK